MEGVFKADSFVFSIKEIINASKVINTPVITAQLVAANSEQAARIVKGRIEKTYLRDIASIVAPTYNSDEIFLSIQVDMEAIRKLQLEVDLNSIAKSIQTAPKLRIAASDVRRLPVSNKIRVYARPISEGENPYARLMSLTRQLPNVVVKGIMSCSRAIISEEIKGQKKLVVEGNGFRQVMTTDGGSRHIERRSIADISARCRRQRDDVESHLGRVHSTRHRSRPGIHCQAD